MLQYAPVCWRFVLARFGGRLCCHQSQHQSQHQSLLPSELELGEWVMSIRQPRWPRWVGWHGQPIWTRCLSGVQVMSPVNQDVQVVSTASAVGAVSKWSAQQCCWISSWDVHNDSQHVSTICSTRWCTISVHQCWSRRPRCQVPSWSSIRFQSGKYEDQVGQQQKQWIQTDVRKIKTSLLRLSCQLCSYWLNE